MNYLELLQLAIFIIKVTIVFILIVGPYQRLTRIIPIPHYLAYFLTTRYKFFFRENSFQYPDMTFGWVIAYCLIVRLVLGTLDDMIDGRGFRESLTWRQLLRGPLPRIEDRGSFLGSIPGKN